MMPIQSDKPSNHTPVSPSQKRRYCFFFCLLTLIIFSGIIAAIGLTHQGSLSPIFSQFQGFDPPDEKLVWIPAAILLALTQIILKISPYPKVWSRWIIVTLLFVLMMRYILWRALSTLNLSDPINGVLSCGLLFLELVGVTGYTIDLFLMLGEKNRCREADRMSQAVLEGSYQPSVAVLIPTYSEPAAILRRTVMGCQAMDYLHKSIYVLDDQRRPEIKKMTEELGCYYLTRPDNKDAKAGNLNHAIAQIQCDLIAVFDSDFVPTQNFLTRTVGFFQNLKIGLVQTHQCFYNEDAITRTLGLEGILPHDVEIFSRHYQPIRDGSNSALCYGSAFVVRQSALESVGGFYTGTLGEDHFTGICLSAKGHQVIYLDENLSAGLAAENMITYIAQRQRWACGSLQSFFVTANPLTISGFRLKQRLAYVSGLISWFNSLCLVIFLWVPLVAPLFNIIPIQTTTPEFIYFFLPYYLVQFSTFSWLNHRSRSALISAVYSIIQCFPVSLTIVQTLISPFSKPFKVTPKGLHTNRLVYHWKLAAPLIIIFIATIFRVIWNWYHTHLFPNPVQPISATAETWLALTWVWMGYHLFIITIALVCFLDVPPSDQSDGLKRHYWVQLQLDEKVLSGFTDLISEAGTQITLKDDALNWEKTHLEMQPVTVDIVEEKIQLAGTILKVEHQKQFTTVQIEFQPLNQKQQRDLITLLFCQPGQWKCRSTPGELRLLGLLAKSLVTLPQRLRMKH